MNDPVTPRRSLIPTLQKGKAHTRSYQVCDIPESKSCLIR